MDIINGNIYTMEGEPFENGYIKIKEGKIIEVGSMEQYTGTSAQRIDAKGGVVLPGFVDSHTHLGLFEEGIAFEGEDGNEDTDPCTPHLRALDGINVFDISFEEALQNGVTAVAVSPGSANPIGGQIVMLKTAGKRIDRMILKEPLAMKMALGENPKNTYNSKSQTPVTRMATASLIREQLKKAQEYHSEKTRIEQDDECDDVMEFDFKSESLVPVLKREIPVHFHVHRADDMHTAMRIAKEFNLKYVLVHGTESMKIADDLLEEGVSVILGPVLTDRSKPELRELSIQTVGKLSQKGVLTAITTDHPETPLKFFSICGGVCVKNGMDYDAALRAMTINGAKICGVDDRIGSIKVGKDADVVVFDGDPLGMYTKVQTVIVDGIIVFE